MTVTEKPSTMDLRKLPRDARSALTAPTSPRGVAECRVAPAGDLAELLKLSGRGDEAAFAELYDATSARAYGLAVRVVRDPSQAEEVAQEAFLEIWRTASRFDAAKGSAVSWILTIVHRKAVDRVRSARGEHEARHDVPPGQPDAWSTTPPPRRPRPRWKHEGSGRPWTH